MLEDPSYAEIVRWGDEGDSFVVLECEKFTKTILPKHFKHSNFASFVRQLNKYDFHKVRQNNEENGQSPYGQNAWEFKHPEFRANSKESLDNIRRKAPAPRKQAQSNDDGLPTQQIDLLNQQIVAQQQQIQHLSDRYAQLTVDHQLMLQELMRVQKTVLNHENVIHQVMTYLLSVDRQRRDSKGSAPFPAQGQPSSTMSPSQVASMDDEPSSPLQHASKLLNDMNAEIQFNLTGLDSAGEPPKTAPIVTTPSLENAPRNGVVRPPTAPGANPALVYPKMNGEIDQVVYPVGATNGIDPMYSDHVNNVPYPMPPKQEVDESRRQFPDNRKKSTNVDPGWMRPPQILLVEDDATCRQIGGKFLYSFQCVIDTAFDGLEAVNKIQDGSKYDLILMDIIMPNLDGVSACHLIRQFDRTPIIAMTSNIRSDDIQLYFQHGMDDVLPKPFTRKSLLDMLEKHLVHLKTMPQGIEAPQPAPAAVTMAAQSSAGQSVKEDSSPGQSPAASMSNWQSPGQFQGMPAVHPNLQQVPGQYVPATPAPAAYAVDQNGVQYPTAAPVAIPAAPAAVPAARPPPRRPVSDMAGVAESPNMTKRPRVYAHPPQSMVNPVQATRTG
ncbi:putative stress response transcription factor SrrA/Skn7 [Aspergillus affinis]|uniref:putative stress response transcription factor SrrA/Skn7 n=1 Tax=Aspergillus affinis TaxID=1070780 RepID=UPI0022FE714B|nr:stress response regulator/HFS transcription factor [Aspergillus affinis]KAI9038173.1 stress response regulator/HFS transcription factor [Aspergillus affinis]